MLEASWVDDDSTLDLLDSVSRLWLRVGRELDVAVVLSVAAEGARSMSGADVVEVTFHGDPDGAAQTVVVGDPVLLEVPRDVDVIPVLQADERVGTIRLVFADGQRLSPRFGRLLDIFAGHVGVALKNAGVYQELTSDCAEREAITHSGVVGGLVVDASDGKIASMTKGFAAVLSQWGAAESDWQRTLDLLSYRMPDGTVVKMGSPQYIEAVGSGIALQWEPIEVLGPGGFVWPVVASAKPVFGSDGQVVFVVVALQSGPPADLLARLRTDFAQMIGRSLSSSLTAIQGTTSYALASAGELEAVQVAGLFGVIGDQASRMASYLNDLARLSVLEAGIQGVATQPVRVAELVEEARLAAAARDYERHLVGWYSDLDLVVNVDPKPTVRCMIAMVEELVRSAVEPPAVRLSVSQQACEVCFVVERGFEGEPEFTSLATAGALSSWRNGFGGVDPRLALTVRFWAEYIKALGGNFIAESEAATGAARFVFRLPVATCE